MTELPDNSARITLGLLNAVDEADTISQRRMADDLGIALGLANAYLKRCVKKGFVKVRQAPRNRYAYYLTPKGFAEKSRLTAEYLGQSFSLFRQAREQYAGLFGICEDRGWRTVALWGAGDLAEIALLLGSEGTVSVAGIVDAEADAARGIVGDAPIVARLDGLGPVDGVVITGFSDPQRAYDDACRAVGAERVLAPKLLHVSTHAVRRRPA
jgi:DNA-binding MarR family transcriptional regulator